MSHFENFQRSNQQICKVESKSEKCLKNLEVIKLAAKVNYEINPKDEYPKNYSGKIKIRKINYSKF